MSISNVREKSKIKYIKHIFYVLKITLAFGARRKTLFVFLFSIFVTQLYLQIKKRDYLLLASMIITLVFGLVYSTTPKIDVRYSFTLEK